MSQKEVTQMTKDSDYGGGGMGSAITAIGKSD